eukprot:365113-Chlamydomonas_euryale.AAC.4
MSGRSTAADQVVGTLQHEKVAGPYCTCPPSRVHAHSSQCVGTLRACAYTVQATAVAWRARTCVNASGWSIPESEAGQRSLHTILQGKLQGLGWQLACEAMRFMSRRRNQRTPLHGLGGDW